MKNDRKMYKIYSRARFNLFKKKRYKNAILRKKIKTTRPVFVVFLIAIFICYFAWNAMEPVFDELCAEKARGIGNVITNKEAKKIMDKYEYSDLFKIEKDSSGEVQIVSANVIMINKITSELAIDIQKDLEEYDRAKVRLPIGILSGNKFLAGNFPDVKIKIATARRSKY